MILLIDNYDSFTFNIYQMISALGVSCQVVRNDEISLEEIDELRPEAIVLSPGPGRPSEAGITLDVIKKYHLQIPVLGICLGHQAIAEAFGGKVVRASRPVHGKRTDIYHDGRGIFQDLTGPLRATRYHSLVVDGESLPDCLEVTCRTKSGAIMGLRHRTSKLEGVQFHPESMATEKGHLLLKRFVFERHVDARNVGAPNMRASNSGAPNMRASNTGTPHIGAL